MGLLASIIGNILLSIALAIAFIYIPQYIGNDPAIPSLKELIVQFGIPWRGGLVWGISALVIVFLLKSRKQWRWLIVVNIINFFALIILVLFPLIFFIDRHRQLPLRQISQTIIQVQQPQEEIWMVGFQKPTLVFYTQRPIKFFIHPQALNSYLETQTDQLTQSKQILLISRPKEMKILNLQSSDYQQIDVQGVYQLIRLPIRNLIANK